MSPMKILTALAATAALAVSLTGCWAGAGEPVGTAPIHKAKPGLSTYYNTDQIIRHINKVVPCKRTHWQDDFYEGVAQSGCDADGGNALVLAYSTDLDPVMIRTALWKDDGDLPLVQGNGWVVLVTSMNAKALADGLGGRLYHSPGGTT